MTTRAEFLAGVRREMAKTPGLFPATPSPRPSDPVREAAAARGRVRDRTEAVFERFRAEAEAVGVVVHRATTVDEAATVVQEIARARGARRVATWQRSRLGAVGGIAARLADAGHDVFEGAPESGDGDGPSAPLDRLAAADLGLTTADLVVAETGSLVLASGAGKGRAVSLLPACHVAIFGPDQLVESLEEAGVVLEAWHAADAGSGGANIVLVTGPSRTADIELTLIRGVHGPKEVHAVFVDRL